MYKASERKPGWREIVAHPNYLVFYRVLADRVQVEMVAHARQQYPWQPVGFRISKICQIFEFA